MAASADKMITKLPNAERVEIAGLWECVHGDLKKLQEDRNSRDFVLFQNIQTDNITATTETSDTSDTSDNKTAVEAKQLKPVQIVVRRCTRKPQDSKNSERPERPVCVFILFGNGSKRIKAVDRSDAFRDGSWRINKPDKPLFRECFLMYELFTYGGNDSYTSGQLIKVLGVEGGLAIDHFLGFDVAHPSASSNPFKLLLDEKMITLADFEFLKTIVPNSIPSSEAGKKLNAGLEAAFDGIVAIPVDVQRNALSPAATTPQTPLYDYITKSPTTPTPGSATASTPDSSRSANSVIIDLK